MSVWIGGEARLDPNFDAASVAVGSPADIWVHNL